jgi:hypothetical protein
MIQGDFCSLSYLLVACEPPTEQDYAEGLKKNQLVFEFDMPTWEVRQDPRVTPTCSDHMLCSELLMCSTFVSRLSRIALYQKPRLDLKVGMDDLAFVSRGSASLRHSYGISVISIDISSFLISIYSLHYTLYAITLT